MSGHRIAGPVGTADDEVRGTPSSCVAGFAPGPLAGRDPAQQAPARASGGARATARFTTDAALLELAKTVRIAPERDRAVFYAEDDGARLAAEFVAANPGHTRLDELLAQTSEGVRLWTALNATRQPWSDKEEVWWELSHRLAQAASGVVQVFGPARLVEDRPLEDFRHAHARNAYASTVFEKVEWPELESNENVTRVYYNARLFDGR